MQMLPSAEPFLSVSSPQAQDTSAYRRDQAGAVLSATALPHCLVLPLFAPSLLPQKAVNGSAFQATKGKPRLYVLSHCSYLI